MTKEQERKVEHGYLHISSSSYTLSIKDVGQNLEMMPHTVTGLGWHTTARHLTRSFTTSGHPYQVPADDVDPSQ